jgi:hypothetical protein
MEWFHENNHGSKKSLFQEKLSLLHIEESLFCQLDKIHGYVKDTNLVFESAKCAMKMILKDT